MHRHFYIRHAHRLPFPPGDWGNEASITEEGRDEAHAWGKQFQIGKCAKIFTSPVKRCVQTAVEIENSCGLESRIETSHMLGEPGYYIHDAKAVSPIFQNHGIVEILEMIVERRFLPGFFSFEEGCARMLREILNHGTEGASVTHDMNVALLACFIFKISPSEELLPYFLEGIVFTFDEKMVQVTYRDLKIITELTSFKEMIDSHSRSACEKRV